MEIWPSLYWFKGRAWEDSDFINDPSSLLFPPLSSISPISAQTCLVFFFLFLFCCFFYFFCLSYILCFCCKWMISVFLFFSVWKWMDLKLTCMFSRREKSADDNSSICRQKSGLHFCSALNRRGRWPLNVEERCVAVDALYTSSWKIISAYEVKMTLLNQKKKKRKMEKKTVIHS